MDEDPGELAASVEFGALSQSMRFIFALSLGGWERFASFPIAFP
jgi:hypothetical protein